ncbi:putative K+ channel tetramerization subfamily protein [Paratrimastix pyriformis]|uniref:K+ channel tetramerization subfamily protein n=1 Tax=Paratrimastix pyriformis TaxID=342808 RepID=A0ABQ8UIL4_9EUKA|nr:putative K+ channel tetramerization subfamily protein [Paratrimastix pyriformis]
MAKAARFEEIQKELERRFRIPEDVITINVGGRVFTTLKQTLLTQEDSMLAAMFSGRHPITKNAEGMPFIDRNPDIFEKILDYLRTGHPPRWWAHPEQRNDFLEDLAYFGILLPHPIAGTVILTPDEGSKLLEFTGAKSLALLYRGSRDGFQATTFHRLCDGRPRTVTVIRTTTDRVFGGYAAATWNQVSSNYYDDRQAFLFSLRGTSRSPVKIPYIPDERDYYGTSYRSTPRGIYCHPGSGPGWGDLQVLDVCNTRANNTTNLGTNFTSPDGTPSFLTGGNGTFQVAELEVFVFAS